MCARWLVLVCAVARAASADPYGFLSFCPGSTKPLIMTEAYLNQNMFFRVIQYSGTNVPTAAYTNKYFYKHAAEQIAKDPHIDFKNKKTVVAMHGYLDSADFITPRLMTMAYSAAEYNVILVDNLAAYGHIFPRAARTVPQVGNATAQVLHSLKRHGLRAADIEVLGYSLGGQAAAFVGKHYRRLGGERVSAITAIDPTGPCFRNVEPAQRLNPSDADLVQVIHSSAQGFGNSIAMGHADFYINGGDYQYALDPHQPACDEICSHMMGVVVFSLSQISDKFVGIKCRNVQEAKENRCYDSTETNVMGRNVDRTKRGVYYVPVTAYAPFYAPEDVFRQKLVYSLLYDDALSDVDNFILV